MPTGDPVPRVAIPEAPSGAKPYLRDSRGKHTCSSFSTYPPPNSPTQPRQARGDLVTCRKTDGVLEPVSLPEAPGRASWRARVLARPAPPPGVLSPAGPGAPRALPAGRGVGCEDRPALASVDFAGSIEEPFAIPSEGAPASLPPPRSIGLRGLHRRTVRPAASHGLPACPHAHASSHLARCPHTVWARYAAGPSRTRLCVTPHLVRACASEGPARAVRHGFSPGKCSAVLTRSAWNMRVQYSLYCLHNCERTSPYCLP